jgi:hypothetical protein
LRRKPSGLLTNRTLWFDPANPGTDQHEWMFKTASSSGNDEVIADALSAWVVGNGRVTPDTCVGYLKERMGRSTPFSRRLQRQSACAIEHIWQREFNGAELETIRLLNRLSVDVSDIESKGEWVQLLRNVIRFPGGLDSLSPDYWPLLGKLLSTGGLEKTFESGDAEVMRSLEKAGDWEKLEVWMVMVWQTLPDSSRYGYGFDWTNHGIKEATTKLLSQRPSALPRLENLCKTRSAGSWEYKDKLQGICDEEKKTRSP